MGKSRETGNLVSTNNAFSDIVTDGIGIGTVNAPSKLTVQGNVNANNTLPSTVSYASSFIVFSQESEPRDVSLSNDGKTMYVLGNQGNDITYYTLSTPWDITTSSFISQYSIASQLTVPRGFYFKPDGTKFYVVGTTGVGAAATSVNQYTCAVSWNVSTASYDNVAFSLVSEETIPETIEFKPDGTKFYIAGRTADRIFQYTCSTPWNVSTASYDNVSFLISGQEAVVEGIKFSLDGSKLLLIGSSGDDINFYRVVVPWDISSLSFVGIITSLSSVIGELGPSGIYWKPDGTKIYCSGYTNDSVYEFNMTSDADLEVTGTINSYGNTDVYGDANFYGRVTSTLDVSKEITLSESPFVRNIPTISSNYTVTSTYNEMSVGPITINSGITVTVNSGATWSIV